MRFTDQNVKRCMFTLNQEPRKESFDIEKLAYIQSRFPAGITETEMYDYAEWLDSRIFNNFNLDSHENDRINNNPARSEAQIKEQTENDTLFTPYCVKAYSFAHNLVKTSDIANQPLWSMDIPCARESNHHIALLAKFNVGQTKCNIIIDPTFRQFCIDGHRVGQRLSRTKTGEKLGTNLVNSGFSEFNGDSVKEYCNAFGFNGPYSPNEDYLRLFKISEYPARDFGGDPRSPRDILKSN